jgi:hypothetical protein
MLFVKIYINVGRENKIKITQKMKIAFPYLETNLQNAHVISSLKFTKIIQPNPKPFSEKNW